MNPDYSFLTFVVTAFLGLLCGPIILPLIIGIFALRKSPQDEISRIIGFFVLKPVITHPLWLLLVFFPFPFIIDDISKVVFLLVIEAAATIGIVYMFRHLFNLKNLYLWIIILADMSRWLNTVIAFYPEANPTFWSLQWFLACAGFVYPSLLAILAWLALFGRNKELLNLPGTL